MHSDVVQKALELANAYALKKKHDYVGTEHMLIGLIETADPATLDLLTACQLDPATIITEVEKLVMEGPDDVVAGKKPNTPRGRKTLEYAAEEARNWRCDSVEGPHLLLALLREDEGVAAQVLMNLGLMLDPTRETLMQRDVRMPTIKVINPHVMLITIGESPTDAPHDAREFFRQAVNRYIGTRATSILIFSDP